MARISFFDGFLWGAATAAYQIEGSPLADGAGSSIWHDWAHTPRRVRDEYGNPPCYITENGFPFPERPGRDTREDAERIAYLAAHVGRVGRSIEAGVDCRGYFHWTLMDNFEWAFGTSMPFGLLRTDFTTQERQWRASAYWYRDLIARGWMEES